MSCLSFSAPRGKSCACARYPWPKSHKGYVTPKPSSQPPESVEGEIETGGQGYTRRTGGTRPRSLQKPLHGRNLCMLTSHETPGRRPAGAVRRGGVWGVAARGARSGASPRGRCWRLRRVRAGLPHPTKTAPSARCPSSTDGKPAECALGGAHWPQFVSARTRESTSARTEAPPNAHSSRFRSTPPQANAHSERFLVQSSESSSHSAQSPSAAPQPRAHSARFPSAVPVAPPRRARQQPVRVQSVGVATRETGRRPS